MLKDPAQCLHTHTHTHTHTQYMEKFKGAAIYGAALYHPLRRNTAAYISDTMSKLIICTHTHTHIYIIYIHTHIYVYIHMMYIVLSAHYQPYVEPQSVFLHWTNAYFIPASQVLTRIRS
jgi:hypothetical protein